MSSKYFWLAVNGASCAASGLLALPTTLQVRPTPEQLLGFKTREEQLATQKFLLTAPIEEIAAFMQSLPDKIERGEILYMRPANPEPPTKGQTIWIAQPS